MVIALRAGSPLVGRGIATPVPRSEDSRRSVEGHAGKVDASALASNDVTSRGETIRLTRLAQVGIKPDRREYKPLCHRSPCLDPTCRREHGCENCGELNHDIDECPELMVRA